MLASEYGWTIEQVMSCTMRQISFLMRQIGLRKQTDMCMEASIHGIKIPLPAGYGSDAPILTPEEDSNGDAAMRSAMERHVRERHGR